MGGQVESLELERVKQRCSSEYHSFFPRQLLVLMSGFDYVHSSHETDIAVKFKDVAGMDEAKQVRRSPNVSSPTKLTILFVSFFL